MSVQIKTSIIGCGMISGTHVTAMRDAGAAVVGVYDRNYDAAMQFAESNGLKVYRTLEELLTDDTDLVAVCTPSGTHAELAVSILEAGKYAVVEKPIALNLSDCQTILDAEKRTGRFCAPISQLRFSEVYRQVKTSIEDGKFGKMILGSLSMKYYRSPDYFSGSWRGTKKMDGGGALMNQGIHGIDMLCGLLGYPVSINGYAATLYHDIEVEDTATASLVFPSGTLGTIDGSTAVSFAKPRRLELCGTRASVTIVEDILAASEGITLPCYSGSGYNSFRDPASISTVLHQNQYRNILDAAAGKDILYYTAEEAMRTVAVIKAIYESSETGNRVCLSL